jgi:hypothetical protein
MTETKKNTSQSKFDAAFEKLACDKDWQDWTRADFEGLGYWDDQIDALMIHQKAAREGFEEFDPPALSDRDAFTNKDFRRIDRDWPERGTLAVHMPALHELLSRTGTLELPSPGYEGRERLRKILYLIQSSEDEDNRKTINYNPEAFMDCELILFFNDALKDQGKPLWRPVEFHALYCEVLDQLVKEEQDREKRERPGAKPTARSRAIKRIMRAVGIEDRQARRIWERGTADFEYRQTLAREFREDPARCFPAAWELKNGRRGVGRENPRTFRAFVLALADPWDDLSPLGRLRAAYDIGTLPDRAEDLAAVFAMVEAAKVKIRPKAVLDIWAEFSKWSPV